MTTDETTNQPELARLHHEDIRHVVARLPRYVRETMKDHPGLYLAGGFVRDVIAGDPPSDIDFSISVGLSPSAASKSLSDHLGSEAAATKTITTNNAVTMKVPGRLPVQIVTRWRFASAADAIRSYDFTIAQAAIWHDSDARTWRSVCAPRFYADLASRRLTYTSPKRDEDSGGSLLRTVKFLQRGYNIQPRSLAAVTAQAAWAAQTGPRRANEVRSEAELAHMMVAALRVVDPLTPIDQVEVVADPEDIGKVEGA